MIIGIGTDILEIKRIGKILNKHDKKFIKRIYGFNEISVIENKKNNLDHYLSKRFAAKEATWKAFNPKRGNGLIFKEIETLNDKNGKPYLFFSGETKSLKFSIAEFKSSIENTKPIEIIIKIHSVVFI